MAIWDADVTIDESLVKQLLKPLLQVDDLRLIGEGWDNQAWEVNETLIFRFPRRKIAAELIQFELDFLPQIVQEMPCAITAPQWAGEPTPDYPYPFAGYSKIPGISACSVDFTDAQKSRLLLSLAPVLKALHNIPASSIEGAVPADLIGRNDLKRNLGKFLERVSLLEGPFTHLNWRALSKGMKTLSETPVFSSSPCIVHGDLYARHVLVDKDKRFSGLIDWGDLHLGDPALDLSLVFGFFPKEIQAAFFEVYGNIDTQTRKRAVFRAVYSATMVLHYGHEIEDKALVRLGEASLIRLSALL